MSFLNCQKEIPDFLTFYLKYTRFIGGAADTTTEESFNDLKTNCQERIVITLQTTKRDLVWCAVAFL